jgi:tetratricopeptide (TPR) repeat protein
MKQALSFLLLLALPFAAAAQGTDEQLAAQYLKNGEFDKASVIYEKLYRKTGDPFYHSYQIECLLELKAYDEAIKSVEKRIKRESDPVLLIQLGVIFQRSGDDRKAQSAFDMALKELAPSQGMVDAMGQAFEDAGQNEWAVRTYQKGRRLLNGLVPYYFELAALFDRMGKWDLVLAEVFDALAEDPTAVNKAKTMLLDIMARDATGKKAEFFEQALIDRIQRDATLDIYSELLIWHFVQKKELSEAFIQAKAMDRRNREDGSRIVELANIARTERDYDLAAEAFRYVIRKGKENYYYVGCKRDLCKTLYLKVTDKGQYTANDLVELEKEFLTTLDEVGRSGASVPIMNDLAELYVFHMQQPDKGIDMLYSAMEAPGIAMQDLARTKMALGDALLFVGDEWEATLLYSQAEKLLKNDELGREAKLKNAKLAYYTGQFEWAAAQLNVLKAATSQFISNDAIYLALLITDNTTMDTSTEALAMFARADLLLFRNRTEEALLTLDSIELQFPFHSLTDDILHRKAQLRIKANDYEGAMALLTRLYENYAEEVLADDALFQMATIYQDHLAQPQRAMELFQEMLIKHPGSLLTAEARKRYRTLRGDLVN